MIILSKDKYGQSYFEARIITPLRIYVDTTEDRISEEDAEDAMVETLGEYAGSNSGSEWFANAEIVPINTATTLI